MRSVHGHNFIKQGAFTRVDDEERFDLVEADMKDSVVWSLKLQKGIERGQQRTAGARWTHQDCDWYQEGVEEGPGDAVEGKRGLEDGMDTDAPVRLRPVGDDAHDGRRSEQSGRADWTQWGS